MPEIYRHTPFTEELAVRQYKEKHYAVAYDEDVLALEDDSAVLFPDMDFLGIGAESIVVSYHDRPDRAVSYYYEPEVSNSLDSSRIAKYYMHRALSILYPQHFPRFYASAIGEHGGTVRERIDTKPVAPKKWYETQKKWRTRKWKTYNDIHYEFQDLGSSVGLRLLLDRNEDNFGRANNHPVYLDFVSCSMRQFDIDVSTAIAYIQSRKNARKRNPKNADPIADGIVNEEHAFLESMRRLRELSLIYYHLLDNTLPRRRDVSAKLIDICEHVHFETPQEQEGYFETSFKRVISALERERQKSTSPTSPSS